MPLMVTFHELHGMGVPFTRRHIDNLERDGQFQRRVALSTRRVGWVRGEVEEWLAVRLKARNVDLGALGSAGHKQKRKRAGKPAR